MKRILLAATLVAMFNPISATALQLEAKIQGITRTEERIAREQARARWDRWVHEVQMRLQAATAERMAARYEEPTEATAEIPVPLGEIPKIIYAVFGAYGAKAVDVASCESGLNPYAVNESSGAAGLFQLMPFHWFQKFDPFDPWANSRYAFQLSSGGTNWSAWSGACA